MKTKINSIGLEKDPKDTTVVVAMSGGVDSSTVAGMMKKDGYKVIGITLKLYDDTKQTALTPISRGLVNLAYKNKKENWKYDFTCNYVGESRIPEHSKITYTKSDWFMIFNSQITNSNNNFDLYIGVENLSNYVQENPIISSENPDSVDFDASLIYGPVMGRLFYAGLRYKFNRN